VSFESRAERNQRQVTEGKEEDLKNVSIRDEQNLGGNEGR
jgi:hypothetical protein